MIVSYNTRSDLENCLQSLHEHPPHVPHEIVVVDNHSRLRTRLYWTAQRFLGRIQRLALLDTNLQDSRGTVDTATRDGSGSYERHIVETIRPPEGFDAGRFLAA